MCPLKALEYYLAEIPKEIGHTLYDFSLFFKTDEIIFCETNPTNNFVTQLERKETILNTRKQREYKKSLFPQNYTIKKSFLFT